MYFKKTIQKEQGDISMDAAMMRLLLAIDENKSIAEISKEIALDLLTTRKALEKLYKLGLVAMVTKTGPVLDQSFCDQLRQNIAKAVGPIGEFLVEDVASDMKFAVDKIPISRAPDLIEALAKEIPDEQMRLEFVRSTIGIIPKG
ncbi:MAG: hypothetical protein JEZ11_24035 [Desulfobacterales bacterium]|nr:hypothetical protein [Desulfobacterales bacterium]